MSFVQIRWTEIRSSMRLEQLYNAERMQHLGHISALGLYGLPNWWEKRYYIFGKVMGIIPHCVSSYD